jgi:serine/threonine-protein kinase
VSRYPSIVIPEKLIGMEVNAAKEYLNDKGIAVVLSGVSNDNEQGYVVSVDPVVGARYTQEGSDSVVTLFYE